MEINEKLNELFTLLDNNSDIKKIEILKDKITEKELALVREFRNNPTIDNKKRL